MCIQEIAAIIGPDGASIPLNEAGNVVVYRQVLGSWQKDREMAFVLSPVQGLRELRRQMEDLKASSATAVWLLHSRRVAPFTWSLRKPGARSGRLREHRISSSTTSGAMRLRSRPPCVFRQVPAPPRHQSRLRPATTPSPSGRSRATARRFRASRYFSSLSSAENSWSLRSPAAMCLPG